MVRVDPAVGVQDEVAHEVRFLDGLGVVFVGLNDPLVVLVVVRNQLLHIRRPPQDLLEVVPRLRVETFQCTRICVIGGRGDVAGTFGNIVRPCKRKLTSEANLLALAESTNILPMCLSSLTTHAHIAKTHIYVLKWIILLDGVFKMALTIRRCLTYCGRNGWT